MKSLLDPYSVKEIKKLIKERDRSEFSHLPTDKDLKIKYARRAIELIAAHDIKDILNDDVPQMLHDCTFAGHVPNVCAPGIWIGMKSQPGEVSNSSIEFSETFDESNELLYRDEIGLWELPTYKVKLYRTISNASPTILLQREGNYSRLYKFAAELEFEFSGSSTNPRSRGTFEEIQKRVDERMAINVISNSPIQKMKIHRSHTTTARFAKLPDGPVNCRWGDRSYLFEPLPDRRAKITRTS